MLYQLSYSPRSKADSTALVRRPSGLTAQRAQAHAAAVDVPETNFARLGDDRIAYQVMGGGPIDLLYMPAWGPSLDLQFDLPAQAALLRRLASFSRLIMFDRRGSGASDSISYEGLPPWEQWADDARAVLDAVGSERAAVLGHAEGGPTAILFAATEPERTRALILFTTSARFLAADDYPWGLPEDALEDAAKVLTEIWATEAMVDFAVPSMAGDQAFRRWFAKTCRAALSPGDAARYFRLTQRMDVRQVLPSVRAPTLVIHRKDFRWIPVEQGRYLAEHIPGAKFVEVPGEDGTIYTAPAAEILDALEEFLTGERPVVEPDRVLAAVLFTDIVGSTERAATLGDRRWKELLDRLDRVVHGEIEQFGGRLVNTAGDGHLATFDGPGKAIRCARSLIQAVSSLGIQIRAGLHTGEVQLRGTDVGGIAVNIGARVASLAGPSEVLVSRTVTDLVAGSGIEFEDRGEHTLKGVPGEWRLYAVRS